MEWISVKDRLPSKYVKVLAAHKNGTLDINFVDSMGCFLYEEIYGDVAYWKPLSEPPKED